MRRRSRRRSNPVEAEHYAAAFPEVYKQAVTPPDAIDDIAIIEELNDDSVKLVLSDHDDDETAQADLVFGRPVGVAERIAADAAVDGCGGARRAAVHRHPSRRAAGVDLPVQDLAAADHPVGATGSRAGGDRRPLRRRGDRDLARPRGDRPVQRTGPARRPDLAAGCAAAQLREIPSAGGVSLQPVAHRVGDQRKPSHRKIVGRLCSRRCSTPTRRARRKAATRRPLPPPSPRTSTRWSAWTPTGCCARSPR